MRNERPRLGLVTRNTAVRAPRSRNMGDVIIANGVNFVVNLGKQILIVFSAAVFKAMSDYVTRMGDEKAQSIFNENLRSGDKDITNRSTSTRSSYYQNHDNSYYEKYASGYGSSSFPGLH